MTTIFNNLQQVQERIAQACARAGRNHHSVTLLAVSKTFGPQAVQEAALAGQRAFGENYIQEAIEKITALKQPQLQLQLQLQTNPALQWHCIGPIQSNKTRLVAEHFDWAHTIDKLKIAQRLSDQRPAHLPPLQVCIQVNVDGSTSKSGVAPEEALALARAVALLPKLQLRGLMAIPEFAPNFVAQYASHIRARAIFDQIKTSEGVDNALWDTLSLGMTADLEPAIAAGSTLVRVGSGIFGDRHYPIV